MLRTPSLNGVDGTPETTQNTKDKKNVLQIDYGKWRTESRKFLLYMASHIARENERDFEGKLLWKSEMAFAALMMFAARSQVRTDSSLPTQSTK